MGLPAPSSAEDMVDYYNILQGVTVIDFDSSPLLSQ